MKTAALENANLASSRIRVGDFAELVKARLTLLVLLTTAVGFYLGAESSDRITTHFFTRSSERPPPPPARPRSINGGNTELDALMHRTQIAPDSGRSNAATAKRWCSAACCPIFGVGLSGDCLQRAERGSRRDHDRYLHFRLHSAEARQHVQHRGRRIPGRDCRR